MSRQNIFVRNLPRSTTREQLADFLWRAMSLQVDPDRMFLHKFSGEKAAASIRIGAGDIAELLNLYLLDKPFEGNILTFEVAERGNSSRASENIDAHALRSS